MDLKEFLILIQKKRQTISLIVILSILFVAGSSLLFPLRYESKSRLLISQETVETDAYALSRSNEYLGNLFAEVTNSSSFYELAMETPYNIDKNYFSGNYAKQIKQWRNTVKTKTIADSGIVEIRVYHTSPYQAQQISLAVNEVLMNNNSSYQGNGDKIKVNVIDQPLISNYPVKPNLLQNTLLAFMFSSIFSLFYIYIYPEERYDIKLFGSNKSKMRQQKKEQAVNAVWFNLPINNSRAEENKTPEPIMARQFNQTQEIPRGNINNILK